MGTFSGGGGAWGRPEKYNYFLKILLFFVETDLGRVPFPRGLKKEVGGIFRIILYGIVLL